MLNQKIIQETTMRIGTWNLNNRRVTMCEQFDLLVRESCDVWLLTEVNPNAVDSKGMIAGYNCHLSMEVMGKKQHWAGILSHKELLPIPDPHPASTAAIIDGITFCSSILPWKGTPSEHPWVGPNHAQKTGAAIGTLLCELPKSGLVWGGDWNHPFKGRMCEGSKGGLSHIISALTALHLQVPTIDHLCHNDICNTIDHIAVPISWTVAGAKRIEVGHISDHDAYVVEVFA